MLRMPLSSMRIVDAESRSPLLKYAERLFSRQAFIDSMTASEKAMRR